MNFIALDFETAEYSQESACSVGLVKFLNGKAADTFYSLICPPVLYIRPEFTGIHGLTVKDVRDAPNFAEVWESGILPFTGNLPMAAHNAAFDIGVLRAALNWYGMPIPSLNYFCTLKLARAAWPELQSHALTSLGKEFGIHYDAHNALEDAQTCGLIAHKAAEKYGCTSLLELLKAAKMAMGEITQAS
ncbi:MAG: 3'-5' exonuclease [Spirochaetaceae bacterium]|jgi:DNA polymerase-3 subunit epsilon|nr:3'-5' exonuclease [Spirochaetaceae bacterium]